MGLKFFPDRYLKKVMPRKMIKNGLVYTDDLTLKKTYLKALVRATGVSGREIDSTIYKVLKQYRAKEKELKAAGVQAFKEDALNNQALLTDRVSNLLVWNEMQNLKEEYKGKRYKWLPSGANTPDPQHQLLYGKIFDVGEGDKDGNMPGERYGCQCGAEFLD